MKYLVAAIILLQASVCLGDPPTEVRKLDVYAQSVVLDGNHSNDFEIVEVRVASVPRTIAFRNDDCTIAVEDAICSPREVVIERVEVIRVVARYTADERTDAGWDVDEGDEDYGEELTFQLPIRSVTSSDLARIRELGEKSANPFTNWRNRSRVRELAAELFDLEVEMREIDARTVDRAASPLHCDDEYETCTLGGEVVYETRRIKVTTVTLDVKRS